jgi:4,5:9,10-diseco-3-hydroxy-5,9,17-trioxoandrosta-1(10),2-diene-4-oate hydrolase
MDMSGAHGSRGLDFDGSEDSMMSSLPQSRAGLFVAVVLALDGAVHAWWATGMRWPASDARTLSRLVLGSEDAPFTAAVVGPLAGLLLLGSMVALGRSGYLGRLGDAVPHRLFHLGMVAICAGVTARALFGLAMIVTREPGTEFYWRNLMLYTPLSLALAAASGLIMRPPRSARVTPGRTASSGRRRAPAGQ